MIDIIGLILMLASVLTIIGISMNHKERIERIEKILIQYEKDYSDYLRKVNNIVEETS